LGTIRLSNWLQYYDQDRLIDSVSGWQDRFGIGHIKDIHDYTKNIYLPSFDDENRALVLGGFGLIESGWSYNSYSDSYIMTYAFEQLILNLSSRLSEMIYTQFSDVKTESNGILTYNRKQMKFVSKHLKSVLKNDFSHFYKLKHIWNLTTIPYKNYTNLSLSKSFNIIIENNLTSNHYFYFYLYYLYSQGIKDYHYISLPSYLFYNLKNPKHFLNINLHYIPSLDDEDRKFVYTNRTYFYLNLAILSE